MEFKTISIDDKDIFDRYINNEYENCEAVFGNLFIWRNISNTRFCLCDSALCVVYTKSDGRIAACYPFGNFDLKTVTGKLREYFKSQGQNLIFESVTNEACEKVRSAYESETEIYPDRSLFDYVYTAESLTNLSGKKLHSKRNHINKFLALYENFEYKKLEPSMFDECMENVNKWLLEKYLPSDIDYKNELTVISECFKNYEKLGLVGGALFVNGKIAAFTIGERYFKNSCVVHIEKADTSIEGAYTMINNLYIKNEWQDVEFVNREEDMGLEGIRKAKMSYRPHHMVEKNTIIFIK